MPLILLLDNKDSFVWNLAQALAALGAAVDVIRSEGLDVQSLATASALVLSPGPGRPEQAGCSLQAVQRWSGHMPILGVCLGHQTIAHAFGAAVVRGEPCHGIPSEVQHNGGTLYRGMPERVAFCRYHSLVVAPSSLPPELLVEATTADGVLMGIRHREHKTFGVQFHPESFRSPHGRRLLQNFLEIA